MAKKIYWRILIISLISVLVVDFLFVVVVAFVFEYETPIFQNESTFEEILKNDNDMVTLNDYCLLNWDGSKEGKLLASELPKQVVEGRFKRVSRFESVLIQLLQNRFNSIVQVFSIEIYNESQGNAAGQATFLELGGTYYIIVGYTLMIDKNLEYTTAVFKAKSDISEIRRFETDKPRFNDYHFYPLSLSPLFSSIYAKMLNIVFVISEVTVVYFILVRRRKMRNQLERQERTQSGDG